MSERYLRRHEAAEYLLAKWNIRRAPATLAKLAVTGGGPRFCKAGRAVLYPRAELDRWAEHLLSPPVGSTSEYRSNAA